MTKILLFLALVMGEKIFAQSLPSVKIEELTRIIDSAEGPLVVNFWATWCAPCVKEIPYFEKQVETYKTKGVQMILVSLDFPEDYPVKLPKFIKNHGYTSRVVWLNETNADIFCPKIDKSWEGSLPVTLFVNKSKNYRHFIGSQLKESALRTELDKLVGEAR